MKLTKQDILNLNPCRDGLKFAASCDFDAAKIWEKCERGDWLIWLLRKTRQMDKPTAVKIAVACAGHVLKLYESKNPNYKRPRLAIAAYAFAANAADAAAEAADASAYAAYAFAAASADAAAEAAYFAASADADASADASAEAAAERKWQADAIRKIMKCPFV